MLGLSIGEVARRARLRPSAIRYYEKAGLLPVADRSAGRRRYEPDILERLAIIRFAQYVGFQLSEIKLLLDGMARRPPPHRWRMMARQKIDEVSSVIRDATAVRALLRATLRHKCPMLVERGTDIGPYSATRPQLTGRRGAG